MRPTQNRPAGRRRFLALPRDPDPWVADGDAGSQRGAGLVFWQATSTVRSAVLAG